MNKLFDENTVFGFKAFRNDGNGRIFCREKEYFPGKINYDLCINPRLCNCGIHFCVNIKDVDSYYSLNDHNVTVYPVAAVGKIDGLKDDNDKLCTNALYIFNNPIPAESKVKFSRYRNNERSIKLIDNTIINYPFDECEKYYLDKHKTETVVYGGYKVNYDDISSFFSLLESLSMYETRQIEMYFSITKKLKTYRNFLMVSQTKPYAKISNQVADTEIFDKLPIKCGKTAIKKHDYLCAKLGLFKINDSWFYAPELREY